MKILHIGDIHLGCTLENQRRNDEIEKVFEHLADFVRENGIGAALLAGDVFDRGSPSSESQELYYGFLLDLQQAGCRQVIVIAGNHDSARFLDAPRALLKRMNIHVIGSVTPCEPEKEVITLGAAESPDAFVCAVPFLNERDVRQLSPEGESEEDRDAAIARGIEKHYRTVFEIADRKRDGRNIPIIGMGHLYAAGSRFAGGDDVRTPVGTLKSVDLSACAEGYAYMALGHLHRPQSVQGHENWRYAGSILPMELREHGFTPQVVLLESTDPCRPVIHELPGSCFHEMKVIRGDAEELRSRLNELDATGRDIWIKAVCTGPDIRPNWAIDLRQEFRDRKVRILVSETERPSAPGAQESSVPAPDISLSSMTPEGVFLRHLDKKGEVTDPVRRETYLNLFRSAMRKVCDPTERRETDTPSVRRGIMKIERLYIRNVNSLYGENRIDFTGPEFHDGIFLISGNTGAGKSSILDAICLALFGATPRASVSQSRNCIMSEGAGDMQAELTFTLGPSRYRACFQQQRTIRAQMPFAAPQQRLYKDDVQVPGTSRTIREEIVRLIGMDQTQFCRCVLLAQGSFDAFLKAGTDERSAILRNNTGTEIYSEIGRQIHADYAEVKDKYELAKQALEGITLLTEEEREELRRQQEALTGKLREATEALKRMEKLEELFASIDGAEAELTKASEAVTAAETARQETMPRRRELEDATRALNCEKAFLGVQELKKRGLELQKSRDELAMQRNQLDIQAAEQNKKCADLNAKLEELTKRQKSGQEIFRTVRLLDDQILTLRNRCAAAEKELAAARADLRKVRQEYQKAEEKWIERKKSAEEAEEYCRAHESDKDLPQKKTAWELRRAQLVSEEARNAEDQRKLADLRKGASARKQEIERNRQKLRDLEERRRETGAEIETRRGELKSLLLGKTCQELRESWAAAMKLDDLFRDSTQRQEYLQPGRPCPLCGSLRHPYCEGTPVPDGREFAQTAKALGEKIRRIEACQEELRKSELQKGKCEAEIGSLQSRIAEAEAAAAAEEKTEQEQTVLLNGRCRETAEKMSALAAELESALGTAWSDHSVLPAELDQRIDQFEKMRGVLESLTAEKERYEQARAVYGAMAPQSEEQSRRKEREFTELTAEKAGKEQARREKFGEKDVTEEENRMAAELELCRKECEAIKSELARTGMQLQHNEEEREKTAARMESLASETEKAQESFSEILHRYAFESPADFEAKRRDPQRIQELTGEIRQIDNRLHSVKGALAERQKMRAELQEKLPEGTDRTANLRALEELRPFCERLQEELNTRKMKRAGDDEAREKHEKTGKTVAALGEEFRNWKYLDDNFGSVSTDRFGRIAQGYTFRELLHYANGNRLQSLRQHFTLVNDDEDPLELNVIDHYRGDLIRTSRNLSGGECFEVSLALALGLAEMSSVSQNASLGNVLLDEGFGTLDDDSLESALELLMQLRRTDRKLVGIISHVSKLKERIATRIEVTGSGGMGFLSGAGVATLKQAAKEETTPGRRGRKAKKAEK